MKGQTDMELPPSLSIDTELALSILYARKLSMEIIVTSCDSTKRRVFDYNDHHLNLKFDTPILIQNQHILKSALVLTCANKSNHQQTTH